jgi:NADP oxidoreductase coenzyme F420-dependent/Domain of unknown function (DUF4158)
VAQYLGWRAPAALEFKELDEFLLARAMEHDSPSLLFRLACEYLISAKVIRPGPIMAVKRVAHAREQAQRETYDRLAAAFTPERCAALDGLLVTDPDVGMTRLRWLGKGPVEASPVAVRAEVGKLEFLRGLGAHELDLSVLPAERRRFLATMGRRLTGQALTRRDPQRRYPILLTVLAQSAVDVLDEVVALFDQAVSAREGKAERLMRDALAERGRVGEDRQELLDAILAIVADPAIPDDEVGGLICGDRIGWARLRAAQSSALPRLPRDHGHLAALAAGSYGYLRQFIPHVLDAVTFAGGTASAELLAAEGSCRTGPEPIRGRSAFTGRPPSRSHATGTTPSPAACLSTQETTVGGGTGPWWPLPRPRTARSALSRPRTGEGPARRGGAGPVGPNGSATGRGTRRGPRPAAELRIEQATASRRGRGCSCISAVMLTRDSRFRDRREALARIGTQPGGFPGMATLGLIGSGHIGSTLARLAIDAGLDVVLSNSRGPRTLSDLVDELGPRARAATPAQAAATGDWVVVTIPADGHELTGRSTGRASACRLPGLSNHWRGIASIITPMDRHGSVERLLQPWFVPWTITVSVGFSRISSSSRIR